jgi:hypothetical protein
MAIHQLRLFLRLFSALAEPNPVVTIQRRGIGNDYPVAFLQAVEYFDLADGVAPEFY